MSDRSERIARIEEECRRLGRERLASEKGAIAMGNVERTRTRICGEAGDRDHYIVLAIGSEYSMP